MYLCICLRIYTNYGQGFCLQSPVFEPNLEMALPKQTSSVIVYCQLCICVFCMLYVYVCIDICECCIVYTYKRLSACIYDCMFVYLERNIYSKVSCKCILWSKVSIITLNVEIQTISDCIYLQDYTRTRHFNTRHYFFWFFYIYF